VAAAPWASVGTPEIVATALGAVITTTVEGRERYSVILRYPRDFGTSRTP
jgi:hypothetical protein